MKESCSHMGKLLMLIIEICYNCGRVRIRVLEAILKHLVLEGEEEDTCFLRKHCKGCLLKEHACVT